MEMLRPPDRARVEQGTVIARDRRSVQNCHGPAAGIVNDGGRCKSPGESIQTVAPIGRTDLLAYHRF
jgi:hypothetical protein